MEDSINKQEFVPGDATNDVGETTDIHAGLRLSGKHDALLPISIVGGLVGMLVGTLPAAIWALIFGFSFSPMYVFMPLFIYWGIKIFKGYNGRRGFFITCIFSVFGFYLTLLSCMATVYMIRYGMLVFTLPLVTITLIGHSGILAGPAFSTVYVFPALFTILGVFLSHALLMHKTESASVPEPEINTET